MDNETDTTDMILQIKMIKGLSSVFISSLYTIVRDHSVLKLLSDCCNFTASKKIKQKSYLGTNQNRKN